MKDDNLGIYCVAAKKFFYLETGNLRVNNPVPRLRNTLQQRGLIDFNPHSYMNTNDYQIVTVKEAKVNDWEIEPIYISQHIKDMVTGDSEDASTPASKRSWGKKNQSSEPVKAQAKKPRKRRTKKTEASKEAETVEAQEQQSE